MKRHLIALIVLFMATSSWSDTSDKSDQAAEYPLTTCVVSGEDLGEHGGASFFTYEGREIRFCCKDCRKDFLADPQKYLKILDEAAKEKAAAAKQKESGSTNDKKAQGENAGHQNHHE